MCIKIVKTKGEIPYDVTKPIEEQVRGSKQVIINYEPNDPSIERFLNEVERVCQTGVSCNLNIKVVHNNYLNGAKTAKKSKHLEMELRLNDIVKMMSTSFSNNDKKLEELASICLNRKCNE